MATKEQQVSQFPSKRKDMKGGKKKSFMTINVKSNLKEKKRAHFKGCMWRVREVVIRFYQFYQKNTSRIMVYFNRLYNAGFSLWI